MIHLIHVVHRFVGYEVRQRGRRFLVNGFTLEMVVVLEIGGKTPRVDAALRLGLLRRQILR